VVCIELANYLDVPPSSPTEAYAGAAIGFFGYIHPNKGVHILVNAAVHLHSTLGIEAVPKIFIRGSPESPGCEKYLEAMKRRVRDAGLSEKIIFGGFVPFVELPSFVASMTAVALPYMIDTRASASGPLLWARTCLIPVLAHRTAVFESSVRDGVDGVLIGIGNLEEWATTLARVAADRNWALNLSAGVKVCHEHGSWKSVAVHYRNVLGLSVEVGP
jgi:glycosyltransferase involved in cell wall biosynthesis